MPQTLETFKAESVIFSKPACPHVSLSCDWLHYLPVIQVRKLSSHFSLPLVKDLIIFQVLYIPSYKEVLNSPVSLNFHCHYPFQGPIIFLLDKPLPGLPASKLASPIWFLPSDRGDSPELQSYLVTPQHLGLQ